jgi:predicted metalloendopeptidase
MSAACGGETAPVAATAPIETTAKPEPGLGAWGFPLETMDTSVEPGDDFFRYANGGWLTGTPIPPERTGTGFSVVMRERNDARIAQIIKDLANGHPPRGSESQKIRDLYLSYIDEARIEIAGLTPFEDALERIRVAQTHEDVVRLMTNAEMAIGGPLSASVGNDPKAPGQGVVFISQSGLGLPDRFFYIGQSKALDGLRAAYLAYISSVFEELNKDYPTGRARDVLALEVAIAKLHWSRDQRRNVRKAYNPREVASIETTMGDFPWRAFLDAKGMGSQTRIILREVSAIEGLADVFVSTPVSAWRDYLAFHYVRANATYMPRRFSQPHFDFFRRKLRGQKVRRPREERAVSFVNGRLEHAVGELYVERYVSDQTQTQMQDMFANIKKAYAARIATLDWMSEPTKQAALAKLEKMRGEIGYPSVRRQYDNLEIDGYDLFANIRALRVDARAWQLGRLGDGMDLRHWSSGPQTVNAFYSHSRNTVFVPAGYVQSPLFDEAADAAINYGAIGTIIGHEIGHGFDDRGAHYDGDGRLQNWWTAADKAAFERAGAQLVQQFDAYEALPDLFVNGRQTLGENIGDLAGMQAAYDAYILSLGGAEAPVLDGYSGAQRFFLGRAQARRYKRTEANVRRRILSDNHSPMSLRVNGIVRNMDVWYDAFNVGPDHDLYLPPETRVRIW